ncbi:MAG: sortase [Clostridiales bacterium]|nr:sortase [Clostridiales bacterium]
MAKLKSHFLNGLAVLLIAAGLFMIYQTYLHDNRPIVEKPVVAAALGGRADEAGGADTVASDPNAAGSASAAGSDLTGDAAGGTTSGPAAADVGGGSLSSAAGAAQTPPDTAETTGTGALPTGKITVGAAKSGTAFAYMTAADIAFAYTTLLNSFKTGPAFTSESAPGISDTDASDGGAPDTDQPNADGSGADSPAQPVSREPRASFAKLLERNPDVAGWINIGDTKIDYEVMYDGTHYYLKHDIDRRELVAGSIYMDPSNNPARDNYNTLLHGHHMKNGTMFKDVVKYKGKTFFKDHRLIQFNTLYDDMIWEVFSVYVLNADNETITTYYKDAGAFLAAANQYKERSMFPADGLEFTEKDRILTLSTCSYETPNSRTIVHARLIAKNGALVAKPTANYAALAGLAPAAE